MYIDKYAADDAVYFDYLAQLGALHGDGKEIIFNFPAYVGAVNLARFFALYEIYKRVIDHAGHIADIGAYKGASFLFFAKLIKLFEPYSPTEAHGFEWFRGQQPGPNDDVAQKGKYVADKARLERLIELQGLSPIAKLYDVDLINGLEAHFAANLHARYKLVFVDCGIRDVMLSVREWFWPRLTQGGIMVLDHYNDPVSPSESALFSNWGEMRQFPFTRSPTAYFVKP